MEKFDASVDEKEEEEGEDEDGRGRKNRTKIVKHASGKYYCR